MEKKTKNEFYIVMEALKKYVCVYIYIERLTE